jgi:hypothetical protein
MGLLGDHPRHNHTCPIIDFPQEIRLESQLTERSRNQQKKDSENGVKEKSPGQQVRHLCVRDENLYSFTVLYFRYKPLAANQSLDGKKLKQ